MAVYCADGVQSDDDGGRCERQPPKDGCIIVAPGWLAYLGLVVERGIYRRRAVVYVICKLGDDIYNRSSAVDVRGLMSRGRQANPVLTYETALRRFFRLWRCIAPMGQYDDDGGRCGEATADGGEVAYLRHAEVGVEENPGTLRCALRTGLWKSAVALRRESANRGMTFLQPLFGGRCEWIGVTG